MSAQPVAEILILFVFAYYAILIAFCEDDRKKSGKKR